MTARLFVSVFAYTFGRVHPDPAAEVLLEVERGENAEWPCFRTLARLRALAGDCALSVDHGASIAKARSRAALAFLATAAPVWVSIDEDIDASAADVSLLLSAIADADIVVAPCPIRDGSRLNVSASERRVRTAHGARVFAIDHGGVAFAAFSRASIEHLARAYPELAFDNGPGDTGLGVFLETVDGGKWWGEGYRFCARARAAGLHVEALLDARIVHQGRATAIDDCFLAPEPPTRREGATSRPAESGTEPQSR